MHVLHDDEVFVFLQVFLVKTNAEYPDDAVLANSKV